MSLVREIAQWADSQAEWMSDAVRRLLAQGSLTEVDRTEIALLMKASVGMANGQQPKAVRVVLDALPASGTPGEDVSITGLRNPKNLNAIGFEDGITFSPTGLTVVYGYNGSGKSGYARALKKACRARDTESILPNVFAPPSPPRPAQAKFEWVANGVPGSAHWQDGAQPPPELSRVAVFDSHCARVFVDNQAEISYIPYGMDLLRELSACMAKVQELLDNERASAQFDKRLLAAVAAGETEVARLVSTVNRKTDPAKVQVLATLSAEEQAELAELLRLFTQDDAHKRAQALNRLAQRLDALREELVKVASPLLEPHLESLRRSFKHLKAAHDAVVIASAGLEDGTLPGTGTDPWAKLLKSAMEFATTAYPDQAFPGPADASCVLCQQPLTPEAHKRLEQFWAFLQADARRTYDEHRKESKDLYVPLRDAPLHAFPHDKALLEEMGDSSPELVAAIDTYVAALKARQETVKGMAATRHLDELPALPASPLEALQAVRAQLLEQAAKLEQGMTPEQRQAKVKRLGELQARVKLAEHLPAVLQAIEADKRDFLFAEALKCCQTRALTQKSGELYEKTVTKDLQEALARELAALGVNVSVTLDLSGQKGTRVQQLRLLKAAAMPRAKLSGILSEGEQRAIAIASFLAEVSLDPSKSGIVFDDPVNSLDHRRRERIAKRLAFEANSRQVVVFTHDLAFASELQQQSKAHGHEATMRHVFAAASSKGHCTDKLPFEAQTLKARINALKDLHARALKALEQEQDIEKYNDLVRGGYRKLRDSWESLVEDHLFSETVKRFRRPVSTQRLRSVSVEDEHAKAIYDGMTRTSTFVHEGGTEAAPLLPEPAEFLEDVLALEKAFLAVVESSKATSARREKLGIPAH
jgi:ABC-type dipeptide/oligopeptide/nickel transport system ATPase subunit